MGNTFGKLFRVTTFGESHGTALGCIIDGCPAGIPMSLDDIQRAVDRRRPGQSVVTTARAESDTVEVLSGIFDGVTLGTPIAMIVRNTNQKSDDYANLKEVLRPGHADYVWQEKYGVRDYRGGGRSSGRETVARVMAGSVAQKILAAHKIEVIVYAQQVGPICGEQVVPDFIEQNMVRAADPTKAVEMQKYIEQAKAVGDSVGGVVGITIINVPVGLGDPVFDKLNANLAKALVSIATVKGVEFGAGFGVAWKKGSENNDPYTIRNGEVHTTKNDSGGISGGISNGEDITIRVAVKPPSSIGKVQETVTLAKKETSLAIKGRHDPCIIPRFIPVAQAMVALVLVDHLLIGMTSRLSID